MPDEDMPECFLAAFVLDHLADEVTMTIETNSRNVIGWSDGSAGGRIVTRRTTEIGLDSRRRVDPITFKLMSRAKLESRAEEIEL